MFFTNIKDTLLLLKTLSKNSLFCSAWLRSKRPWCALHFAFPSKVFSYKIFRIFVTMAIYELCLECLVINKSQNFMDHFLLWSALDFFNYVLKQFFSEIFRKRSRKMLKNWYFLALQKCYYFLSTIGIHTFRCNIYTKKLNFCSVVMLSIYFCCALPSDNGAKVFL